MRKRNIYLILAAAFLSIAAYKIGETKLILGDGTATDTVIESNQGLGTANNPKQRYSATSSSWEFSNDGLSFAPLGSGAGGGGGINLAVNGDFELDQNNWTNTGTGNFEATTVAANVAFGGASGSWDAAAAADKLTSDAILVPVGMKNQQCHFSFTYSGGDSNITASVIDGSANVLGVVTLAAQTEFRPIQRVPYVCPTSPETLKVEFEASADAAIVYIDSVFFGQDSQQAGALGGWKTYDETEVTITSAIGTFAVVGANFKPYKDPINNTWRMAFNIHATKSSAAGGSYNVTIGGVTFKSGVNQEVSAGFALGVDGLNEHVSESVAVGGSDDISIEPLDTAIDKIYLSGDVALASKPTWADVDSSVNLINDSVVYANERFGSESLTVGQSIPDITATTVTSWANTHNNPNFNAITGEYTVPVDGWYNTQVNLSFGATTAYNGNVFVKVDGITKARGSDISTSSGASFCNPTASISLKLVKNQVITIVAYHDSAGAVPLAINDSGLSITRVADFSAGDTSGFGLADTENAGLVPSYEEAAGTISTVDTGITIDAAVKEWTGVRVGKLVVIRFKLKFDYSSPADATPEFALDSLPATMTPSASREVSISFVGNNTSQTPTNDIYVSFLTAGTNLLRMYANSTQNGIVGTGTYFTGQAVDSDYWVTFSYTLN